MRIVATAHNIAAYLCCRMVGALLCNCAVVAEYANAPTYIDPSVDRSIEWSVNVGRSAYTRTSIHFGIDRRADQIVHDGVDIRV